MFVPCLEYLTTTWIRNAYMCAKTTFEDYSPWIKYISLRWYTDQFYVYRAKNVFDDFKINKGGGSTVSVKKRGGWQAAWKDAQVLAGWQTKG